MPIFTMAGIAAVALVATTQTLHIGWLPPGNTDAERQEANRPLEAHLSSRLGVPVKLVLSPSYKAAVDACMAGKVQLAYLGGFSYVRVHDLAGFVPIAQSEDGKKNHSLFITQADSEVRTLNDLKGKTFAFGDRNSTSGYVMPLYFLDLNNLPARATFRSTVNAKGHKDTVARVLDFKVDAGVVNDKILPKLYKDGKLKPGQLRVLWQSPPFPDSVWTASKALGGAMIDKLADAFTSLDPKRAGDAAVLALLDGSHFYRPKHEQFGKVRDAVLLEGLLLD